MQKLAFHLYKRCKRGQDNKDPKYVVKKTSIEFACMCKHYSLKKLYVNVYLLSNLYIHFFGANSFLNPNLLTFSYAFYSL